MENFEKIEVTNIEKLISDVTDQTLDQLNIKKLDANTRELFKAFVTSGFIAGTQVQAQHVNISVRNMVSIIQGIRENDFVITDEVKQAILSFYDEERYK